MKLLFFTDPHVRMLAPRSRVDNFADTCRRKLSDVYRIAAEHHVDVVVCGGDLFDTAHPALSAIAMVLETVRRSRIPTIVCPGNHDLPASNINALERSALGILSAAGYIKTAAPRSWAQYLSIVPYTPTLTQDLADGLLQEYAAPIVVVHGAIYPGDAPYEHVHPDDIPVHPDTRLVLCGHIHLWPKEVYQRAGCVFVNPGSLVRLRIDDRRDRVQVVLVDTTNFHYEMVGVPCAPYAQVFAQQPDDAASGAINNAAIEQYFEEIRAALQGGRTATDPRDMVRSVAEQTGAPSAVLHEALSRIQKVLMEV